MNRHPNCLGASFVFIVFFLLIQFTASLLQSQQAGWRAGF